MGNNHTCGIAAGGTLKCWGWNQFGQLGDGTTTEVRTPNAVPGLTAGVLAVAAGDNQTCAIDSSSALKCWGSNSAGQLGDGTNQPRSTPATVNGLASGVAVVATGDNHTCAALTAGGVKCWGWGTSGQLGNDTATTSYVPVDVVGISSQVVAMSAGYAHTCAVLADGAVKCWGRAGSGQIGNGATVNSRVPVTVSGAGSGGTDVVGGGAHTCAVVGSTATCWGSNALGQLGNGTSTSTSSPVVVTTLGSVLGVAAGASHSCARSAAGGVMCWGDNAGGILGTGSGSPSNSAAPLQVFGLTSGVAEVRAGATHTCAITTGGALSCWGTNENGQLGTGTTSSSNRPVAVTGF